MRVVLALFEGVHRLGLALRLVLHEDGLGPQPAGAGALLDGSGHQRLGLLLVLTPLDADPFEPQLGVLRVAQPSLLYDGTGLGHLPEKKTTQA